MSGEVDTYAFYFQSAKSIKELEDRVDLTDLNHPNWIIIKHCLSTKRVFLSVDSNKPNFTYVCEDLFKDLHITLPFINFECEMITEMNPAPTQLHLNHWAFMKSFKILCQYLNIFLTINQFMYFYRLKMGEDVGWISLSGA